MIPNSPMQASSNASSPKKLESLAISFCWTSDRPTCSDILTASTIGNSRFLDCAPGFGDDCGGLARKVDLKVTQIIDGLRVRVISHRLRLLHQVALLRVRHHADDFDVFAVFRAPSSEASA